MVDTRVIDSYAIVDDWYVEDDNFYLHANYDMAGDFSSIIDGSLIDYRGENNYKSFIVKDLRANRGRSDCIILVTNPDALYSAIKNKNTVSHGFTNSNSSALHGSSPGYSYPLDDTIKRIDLVNNRFSLFKERSRRDNGEFGFIVSNDNMIAELEESLRTILIHQDW